MDVSGELGTDVSSRPPLHDSSAEPTTSDVLPSRICFFTDRPFIVMFPEPVTSAAAREWIRSGSGWNYGFGDTRAVAGHELSLITKPAHEVMMASRDTQPNGRPQDGKELDRAIAKMNTDLLAWAEYWAPRFASRKLRCPLCSHCRHMVLVVALKLT